MSSNGDRFFLYCHAIRRRSGQTTVIDEKKTYRSSIPRRRCRQWACARHCWQREMAVRQREGGKLMACSTCAVSLKTDRSRDSSPADVHTTLLAAGCSGSGNVPCAPTAPDTRHPSERAATRRVRCLPSDSSHDTPHKKGKTRRRRRRRRLRRRLRAYSLRRRCERNDTLGNGRCIIKFSAEVRIRGTIETETAAAAAATKNSHCGRPITPICLR